MTPVNRRTFLATASAAAVAGLTGCGDSGSSGGAGKSGQKLVWWDHTPNIRPANEKAFAKFAKESGGMPVDYTHYQTSKLGQALKLAKQSDQLPDVHSSAGLDLPLPALVKEGWFQPIQLGEEALGRLPKDALVEGIHTLDGKVYTVPITATKQYWAANFFNRELVEKAGLDPANPPKTYDEFRAACKAVKEKGGGRATGWIFGLGQPGRVAEQVSFMAQAAGFQGTGGGANHAGQLFKTGEFAYDSDPYITVIEFLLSLQKDGLMFAGSQTLDDQVARVRWATGVAGYFFDGPWCPGSTEKDAKQFLDKLDVGPMLVPESGMPVTAYRAPQGGFYFLSGASKKADAANKLLAYQTTKEYFTDICKGMGPPPLDPSVVADSGAHQAWKKVVGWFDKDVFVEPVPVVRNPEVQKVIREMKDVKPNLGDIVGGMFAGDVTDVRGALKKLTDASEKERARALAVSKKAGVKADEADWAFANWQPRKDYTKEMYTG
jgi:multiple sugar transport system substrate-binding protein